MRSVPIAIFQELIKTCDDNSHPIRIINAAMICAVCPLPFVGNEQGIYIQLSIQSQMYCTDNINVISIATILLITARAWQLDTQDSSMYTCHMRLSAYTACLCAPTGMQPIYLGQLVTYLAKLAPRPENTVAYIHACKHS